MCHVRGMLLQCTLAREHPRRGAGKRSYCGAGPARVLKSNAEVYTKYHTHDSTIMIFRELILSRMSNFSKPVAKRRKRIQENRNILYQKWFIDEIMKINNANL